MKDKRKILRSMVKARVCISHTKIGNIEGVSRDITDKGIFVELESVPKLPVGAHIRLQFLDSLNPELSFNTRVVRVNEKGLGLVLVDFESNGQRYKINELRDKLDTPARETGVDS